MIKDLLVVEIQLENEGGIGARGEGDKGNTGNVGQQGVQVQEVGKVLKGCVELLARSSSSARTCWFNWWKRQSWTQRR